MIETLADLKPDPRNARRHNPRNVGMLEKALNEVGAARSIVIDEQGVVLAGNATIEAAGRAGIERVQVVDADGETIIAVRRTGLTKTQKTRLALYDNRTAELADWDSEVIADMLATEREVLDGLFENYELEEIVEEAIQPVEADAEPRFDQAAELLQKWKVEPGDLWLLGEHRLLCGDSTKADDIAALLNGQNPALVLADPPYFGKVDADWDNDFDGFEGFLEFLDVVFGLWIPKMIDRGTSGWWCAPDFAWHIEDRLRKHAAVFNHIVWSKGKSLGTTASVEEMRRWRPRSERLLLCEKQHSPDALLASFNAKTAHIAARTAYASIIDRMMAWQKEAGLTNREIDKCLGTNGMAGHYFGRSQWSLPTQEAWHKMRPLFLSRGVDIGEFDAQRQEFDAQRREFDAETSDNLTDVWEMSAPHGEERHGHPTPKPVALISKLVSAHSRADDLVADPFLGSGTTLIAAEKLGRTCYGIEISPAYCAVILERMQAAFPDIKIERAS